MRVVSPFTRYAGSSISNKECLGDKWAEVSISFNGEMTLDEMVDLQDRIVAFIKLMGWEDE
jgi:hypothetical protein